MWSDTGSSLELHTDFENLHLKLKWKLEYKISSPSNVPSDHIITLKIWLILKRKVFGNESVITYNAQYSPLNTASRSVNNKN